MWRFVGTGMQPDQPTTVEYWFHDLCRPEWLRAALAASQGSTS